MTSDDPSDPTDGAEPDRLTVDPDAREIPWARLASVAAAAALVVVLLPFLVYAAPQLVGAEYSYVVLSGSMEPSISTGDVVVVNEVDAAAIEAGDVITFTRGGEARTTTHRVTEVVDRGGEVRFRTKGDANEDPDQQLVPPERVNGRVMDVGGVLLVLPYVGYVIQFASTRTGFTLLFVVPVALLVVSEVWAFVTSTGTSHDDASTAEIVDSGSDHGGFVGGGDGARDADRADRADEPAAPGDGAVVLSATELRLAVAILAAFVAYSLWVAYSVTEVWSVGVAASVVVAFLMAGGLLVFGGDGDPPGTAGGDRGPGDGTSPEDWATDEGLEHARRPPGPTGHLDGYPAPAEPSGGDGPDGEFHLLPTEETGYVMGDRYDGVRSGRVETADDPVVGAADPADVARNGSGRSGGSSRDRDPSEGTTGGDDGG